MGGRAIVTWRWRQSVAELWEAWAGLDKRLSTREGHAGQAAKKAREAAADPSLFGAWLQRMGGATRTGVQVVPDEASGVKLAQAHFDRDVKRKKDAPVEEETG
jgi:hypothetical protein